MDEKIKQLLKDLGQAINESISGSEDVNEHIQKIKNEGYNLYVVLDATIGLGRDEDTTEGADTVEGEGERSPGTDVATIRRDVQFRIDVNDLSFLRSVGIDPTRKIKAQKKLEARTPDSDAG
ncbi:MAG TPA: hypothetical protein VMS12_02210 [Thermoanaerobaculia bacterium]|nr:hypothetical protein [Thermoanaerobaculia bacterium]